MAAITFKNYVQGLDSCSTPLAGTEPTVIIQGNAVVQCTANDIDNGSYLKYVALLSQSGTDAPVATVLENTLGGTIVWTRDNVGQYFGTLASAFPEGKTFSFLANSSNALAGFALYRSDDNVVVAEVSFNGDLSDDLLSAASVEIRVYP